MAGEIVPWQPSTPTIERIPQQVGNYYDRSLQSSPELSMAKVIVRGSICIVLAGGVIVVSAIGTPMVWGAIAGAAVLGGSLKVLNSVIRSTFGNSSESSQPGLITRSFFPSVTGDRTHTDNRQYHDNRQYDDHRQYGDRNNAKGSGGFRLFGRHEDTSIAAHEVTIDKRETPWKYAFYSFIFLALYLAAAIETRDKGKDLKAADILPNSGTTATDTADATQSIKATSNSLSPQTCEFPKPLINAFIGGDNFINAKSDRVILPPGCSAEQAQKILQEAAENKRKIIVKKDNPAGQPSSVSIESIATTPKN